MAEVRSFWAWFHRIVGLRSWRESEIWRNGAVSWIVVGVMGRDCKRADRKKDLEVSSGCCFRRVAISQC